MNTVERGRCGETIAAAYLELLGYRIRRRNLRVGRLEIDLVATRGRVLAFVEVKLRSSPRWGAAVGAVDPLKRRRILAAAAPYLAALRRSGWCPRHDIVTVDLRSGGQAMSVRHYPGVFSPPSSFVS